ncbi:MAG: hypothetical protein LBL38_00785, partial [Lactobacillales bacterium]|nr:hypothetical protein [Lactobacillales bacterium]
MKQKEFKKVISLVLILMSFICLNCLKAKAAVLRQTSGEKVTARGQVVSYFGTSGYQGINTPSEHQNDLTDNWQVMQLADETGAIVANNAAATYALIIKQNPIAVQPYQATGREA